MSPTHILVAFDKFKDCMTALEACKAATLAVREALPESQITEAPLTDGGEGFCAILTESARGELFETRACGPVASAANEQIETHWGCVALDQLETEARSMLRFDAQISTLGIVEMALASGLEKVPADRRDVWQTTSRGTGDTLLCAAQAGAESLLLGIGGSATNDLGLGALAALGLRAYAEDGTQVPCDCPAHWSRVRRFDATQMKPLPPLRIACDVDNPLLGDQGCTAIYGPQKGLRSNDRLSMEAELERMAHLLCEAFGADMKTADKPGMGAAGGIAFGLDIAYDAGILPGMALIGHWLQLEAKSAQADLILTGEGSFDESSLSGKGPTAVLKRDRDDQRRAVFAGRIALNQAQIKALDLHTAVSIARPELSLQENLAQGKTLLKNAVGEYLKQP